MGFRAIGTGLGSHFSQCKRSSPTDGNASTGLQDSSATSGGVRESTSSNGVSPVVRCTCELSAKVTASV